MKNKLILCTTALCCMLFMGCPYETAVGIDATPSVKIDTRLLGTWQAKNSTDSKFIVTKAGDNEYKIEEKKKSGDKSSIYHAFLSDVKGTMFMNAKEDDGLSANYYLYKVVMSTATSVHLIPVTENITEKFATSAELRQFIEKNMGLSFFFDKNIDEYTKL